MRFFFVFFALIPVRWESDSEPERDKEYPQLNIDESTDESTKTDRLTPPDSPSPDPSTTTTTITTTRRHSVVLDTIKEESFTEKGLLLYPLMLEVNKALMQCLNSDMPCFYLT